MLVSWAGWRGLPLGGILLGGIPLGGILLGGIPLGGILLGGILLGGIPLGGILLGGICPIRPSPIRLQGASIFGMDVDVVPLEKIFKKG